MRLKPRRLGATGRISLWAHLHAQAAEGFVLPLGIRDNLPALVHIVRVPRDRTGRTNLDTSGTVPAISGTPGFGAFQRLSGEEGAESYPGPKPGRNQEL